MEPLKWSPDGNWIAAWLGTSTALCLITIDTHTGRTTTVAPLNTEGSSPVLWSPDSARIAYEATLSLGSNAQFAIATVDPDGSNRKVFWNRRSKLYVQSLAWSPDSSKLLFLARTGGESGPLELFTVSADGSGFTRIH